MNDKILNLPTDYPDFTSEGQSLCAMVDDPDLFTPDSSEPDYRLRVNAAKAICMSGCPYIEKCLNWAVKNNENGIWGGTTERERRTMRRNVRLGIPISIPRSI